MSQVGNSGKDCGLSMLVAAAMLCCGCGSSADVNRSAVKGSVMLDGKPLPEGRILFEPAEGNRGPSAGAGITQGSFEIPEFGGVARGKNVVRINASRPSGKKIKGLSGEMVDEIVEAIPEKYNLQSTLQREIQSGANVLTFELDSK